MQHLARLLKRPSTVQVLEEISFVRLIPHDAVRLDRAEIQSADQIRAKQPIDERLIVRERGDHERWTETGRHRRHLLRRDVDDRHEGEEKLAIRERVR